MTNEETPDLESIIAATLLAHWAKTMCAEGDGFFVECRCGAIGHVESEAEDWEPANQWSAAHQARAVLAAIEGAGSVEWGVFRITDAPVTRPFDEAKFTTKSGAEVFIKLGFLERVAKTLEPRRRLTTPWERAE